MKSLCRLLTATLTELGLQCGTSTERDISYCLSRIENEGFSFLAITLGNFCDDFERGLAEGTIGSDSFAGFNRRRNQSLPTFLSGLTNQVFDSSGSLLDQPSIRAIKSIRQFCRMFKKIELPCTSNRVKEAFDGYVKVEEELSSWRFDNIDADFLHLWEACCDIIVSSFSFREGPGRHGTGAVADRLKMADKYSLKYWYSRSSSAFDPTTSVARCVTHWLDVEDQVEFLGPEQELPVRVTTVPKTLKGPRIIGMEPALMQFLQQRVLQYLAPAIESNPLTRGSVRFSDQTHNGSLALSSSSTGAYATLDLKEASDRVHKDVVYRLLKSNRPLRQAIFACRSTSSELPSGLNCPLWKFASMGSALCFPVESMVFYTILQAVAHKVVGIRPTPSSIRRMSGSISVYGDDLIIPVDWVPSTMKYLEQFCLKVNPAKSFWTGKFRESCGTDAFDGVNVTPVYIRKMPPTSRSDTSGIVSWVSLCHQLFEAGLYDSSKVVHNLISSLGIDLPYGSRTSAFLSSPFGKRGRRRMCPKLHKPFVMAYGAYDRTSKRQLDDWAGFARWVELKESSNGLPVHSTAVPESFASLALKRQWIALN